MPSVPDLYCIIVGDERPYVIVSLCYRCERGEKIDSGNRCRRCEELTGVFLDLLDDALEYLMFEFLQAVLGTENPRLIFLQVLSGKAFTVGEGLLSHVVPGGEMEI